MFTRIMLPVLFAAILVSGAAAQLPNLTSGTHANWQYTVVPTDFSPATFPITVPTTLPGNAEAIYWNAFGWNNGTAATGASVRSSLMLDGKYYTIWNTGSAVATGGYYTITNFGPFEIRGGRHTFGVIYDFDDLIPESNESDNEWAHQFVLTPYDLIDSVPVTRHSPPLPDGGFSGIIDGSPIGANCDGFRFTSTGWWNVVTMYDPNPQIDNDLSLFSPSTGSENGFIGSLTGSYALAGLLDGVIVNRNMTGIQAYDVGVTEFDNYYGIGTVVIEHVTSGIAGVGADMTVHFDQDEYLKIWDTHFPDTGWFTVTVIDPGNTGVGFQVALIDEATTVASISTLPGKEFTDDRGEMRLHELIETAGYYGLVLYRDPTEGSAAMDLTVRIGPREPDLTPGQVPLWHSPVVPTPVPMTGPGNPSLPDTLHGYVQATYLNYGLENQSTVTSDAVNVAVYQDGDFATFHGFLTSGFGAGEVRGDIFSSPFEYPGGRHTLILLADYTDTIDETYETNNIYAEQYCWSPLELRAGQLHSKNSPGFMAGGAGEVGPGGIFLNNCDGYRVMTGNAHWDGIVLTAGPNSDYDLSVHYKLEGVKNGFDDFLASSQIWVGQTDYILFNNSLVPPGAHDVGVENFTGVEPYTVEAVESTTPPMPIGGHYGPYTLPVANMLQLHNVYLEQDLYAFRLDNLAGGVDWNLALHPHDAPRSGRLDFLPNGSSNQGGPGEAEWFTVYINTPGWYCLAVCKARSLDFDLDGQYELTILQGVSDVPDDMPEPPSVTALSGAHPNPFNPQTTIFYDLAVPANVELAIYDLKGSRVRRLVDEAMPAGHHNAVWDGRDSSGSRAASGVYLARFSAGAHHDVMKVVMVK